MNNTMADFLRVARGPVMLTTLGTLLAAHRFTDATFWQLWPVLVIVLGLMKLLEMMAARNAGRSPETGQP
jgi:hypothetical protein